LKVLRIWLKNLAPRSGEFVWELSFLIKGGVEEKEIQGGHETVSVGFSKVGSALEKARPSKRDDKE